MNNGVGGGGWSLLGCAGSQLFPPRFTFSSFLFSKASERARARFIGFSAAAAAAAAAVALTRGGENVIDKKLGEKVIKN